MLLLVRSLVLVIVLPLVLALVLSSPLLSLCTVVPTVTAHGEQHVSPQLRISQESLSVEDVQTAGALKGRSAGYCETVFLQV